MYLWPLTHRESQVAALTALALSERRIAQVLGLRRRTVEMYTLQIYRKWEVANAVSVMRMVWQESPEKRRRQMEIKSAFRRGLAIERSVRVSVSQFCGSGTSIPGRRHAARLRGAA